MPIAAIYITDATETIKTGSIVSVETQPVDGFYQVFTKILPGDIGRDEIIANEVNTGNYLNWPVETLPE